MSFAIANIALGLIGFVWLLLRTSRRWNEYPDEVRLLLAALVAVFFSLLVTSVEMARVDQTLGLSALIIAVVKVFTIYMLWTTRATKYRTGTRTTTGNVGDDQNRDVQ